MVDHPAEWLWSSYRYTLGEMDSPDWLATDAMLRLFSDDRERACERFVAFVLAGVGINIWLHLKQQIYLGDDRFVADQQQYMKSRLRVRHFLKSHTSRSVNRPAPLSFTGPVLILQRRRFVLRMPPVVIPRRPSRIFLGCTIPR